MVNEDKASKDISDNAVDKKDEPSTNFTSAEEKAHNMGHRSKEEWVAEGKDADTWVSAEEFLRRAPLYEGIHKANKQVKNLEKKLTMLAQHQDELVQAKVAQRLEALKVQKTQAAKEHDVEKVEAIRDEMDKLKEESTKKQDSNVDEAKEAFDQWKEENPWYEEDEDMFAYANGIGSKLEKENPNWGAEKTLAEVSKRTKKAFAWKTKNPAREEANKVNGARNGSGDSSVNGRGKLPTYNDLPDEAKATYREFVKTTKNPRGFMTSEQFLTQYGIKAGLIKDGE